MNRIIIIIQLWLTAGLISAQNFEITGGVNRNCFYDFNKEDLHFHSDYTRGFGYSVGLGLSNVTCKEFNLRYAVRLENYEGSFYCTNGGIAQYTSTSAKVRKTVLALDFSPMNFIVTEHIHIGLGGECSFLLGNKTSGTKLSWTQTDPIGTIVEIENDSVKINRKFFCGIIASAGYTFQWDESWSFAVQYRYYLGLMNEFENTEARIKSMRHNFEIGILRKLHKKGF